MRGNILEAVVGAIVLFVAAFFLYFAYTSNGEKIDDGYELITNFNNVGGLVVGADVKISGVKVGIVKSISVDKDYTARVILLMKPNIKIPVDSVARIATSGLIGNNFIAIDNNVNITVNIVQYSYVNITNNNNSMKQFKV